MYTLIYRILRRSLRYAYNVLGCLVIMGAVLVLPSRAADVPQPVDVDVPPVQMHESDKQDQMQQALGDVSLDKQPMDEQSVDKQSVWRDELGEQAIVEGSDASYYEPRFSLKPVWSVSLAEKFRLVEGFRQKPSVVDGVVYFLTSDMRVVGYDKDGSLYTEIYVSDALLDFLAESADEAEGAGDAMSGIVFVQDESWMDLLPNTVGDVELEPSAYAGGVAIDLDTGNIFVSTDKGLILAMQADGRMMWYKAISKFMLGAPVVGKNGVYVMTAAGALHSVNKNTGSTMWTYQGLGTKQSVLNNLHVALLDDSSVIANFPSGQIVRLDKDGSVLWENYWSTAEIKVPGMPPMLSTPVLSSDQSVMLLSTKYMGAGAVNTGDGAIMWSDTELSGIYAPAILGDQAYFYGSDDSLYIVKIADGRLVSKVFLPSTTRGEITRSEMFRFFFGDPPASVWYTPVVYEGGALIFSDRGLIVEVGGSDVIQKEQIRYRVASGPFWVEHGKVAVFVEDELVAFDSSY